MSVSNDNMVMPVSPYGGAGGFGGGDWGSLIVLFLIAAMFGGFGGGWGGFGGNGGAALGTDFPWLLNANNGTDALVTAGFNQAATNNALTGIQGSITSGFGDMQTALCGGFAGVNATVNGAQNALAQQLYTNQIADLERSYAAQTANAQAINGIQSQLAQYCCDNRLTSVQTQNIVQSEGAATRLAIQQQTQAILDKMCQQEIDNLKSANIALQNQVNMLNLAASQTAQTSALIADNTAQTQYLVNKLTPTTTTTTTP